LKKGNIEQVQRMEHQVHDHTTACLESKKRHISLSPNEFSIFAKKPHFLSLGKANYDPNPS
ncbi:MAG: hypothetical protein ACKON9_08735, partial [Planctomycetaceae bacterium]